MDHQAEVLLKIPAFAQRAGLANVTVWKLVAAQRVASVKIGRSRRIPASELDRLIADGLTPAITGEALGDV